MNQSVAQLGMEFREPEEKSFDESNVARNTLSIIISQVRKREELSTGRLAKCDNDSNYSG